MAGNKRGFIFFSIALTLRAWAQTLPVQLGEAAPSLSLGLVLQGEPSPSIHNKARVIEFWATWYGPCKETIPHLLTLADTFKGRSIEFINISDEAPKTVKEFLKTHHLPGIVATDPLHIMGTQFGIPGLPTTVLIDTKGDVAAVTQALRVTASDLEALLEGMPIALPDIRVPVRPSLGSPSFQDSNASELLDIKISPNGGEERVTSAPDRYVAGAVKLRDLLSWVYQIPPDRILMSPALEHVRYDVDAWVPREQSEALRPLLQAALLGATPVRARRERHVMEALLVRGDPSKRLKFLEQNVSTITCRPGHITKAGSMAELQSCLENALGRPVIMEYAGPHRFEFDLRWAVGDANGLVKEIESKLGTTTQVVQQQVPVLVISRIPFAPTK